MAFLQKWFSWLNEALIIVFTLVLVNNYFEPQEHYINADGKGYYDYLPAAFIYHDLNFKYTDTLQTAYYNQKEYSQGYLKTFEGKQINKYFPGVSILWVPFFGITHLYTLFNDDFPADGYSYPYQLGILIAAFFYLFVGLIFLRLFLSKLGFERPIVLFTQITITFGTPILYYVVSEPAFTHVYSFTLITAFSYFLLRFVKSNAPKWLLISAILLGLITIIRPVNVLAIGMIFLFFDSFLELKNWMISLFTHTKKALIVSISLFLLIASFVPFVWHVQTGHFFVWGYQDEGFNFLHPEFFNFLFSFRKGAFLHTPILFIAFVGGLIALYKTGRRYKTVVIIGYFSLIVYVLSSWWAWWYGASFGSRPGIDYYVLFALLLAYFLQVLHSNISKWVAAIILIGFIIVNLIQMKQYQKFIMDWVTMTFEKFQIIGLHTEDKYRGIFFRESMDYDPTQIQLTLEADVLEPVILGPNQTRYFVLMEPDTSVDLSGISHVYIESDIAYTDGTCEFILSINDTNDINLFWNAEPVFGSVLQENLRTIVTIPYKTQFNSPAETIVVGVNTLSDEVVLRSIKVVFVRKD